MSEAKLRDQQDRGQRAQAALKELEDAFQALEADCFDAFRRSDIHDDDGRRTCRLYLRVMDDVRQRFQTAIVQGDAARKELVRLKDPSKLSRMIHGRRD